MPLVPDGALVDAARARAGADAELLVREPLPGAPGGSGAHFEHVVLRIRGEPVRAVLKCIAPDPLGPTCERRFYEELAPEAPVRLPRLHGSGPLAGRGDGWILLEALAHERPASAPRLLELARVLARLHAHWLGRAPDWLPRPFGAGLTAGLAHVPDGVARLRERLAAAPGRGRFVAPEVLDAAVAVARDPTPLARAFARSPESLVHRDLHHHNVFFTRTGPVPFDWEAVSAGPPIFDVALLDLYLRIVRLGRGRFRLRRRPLAPGALEAAYASELARLAPGADVAGVCAAGQAAAVWEIVHRIGWVDDPLGAVAPWAWWALRAPGFLCVEADGVGPVMLHAWRELFASLPARLAALAS